MNTAFLIQVIKIGTSSLLRPDLSSINLSSIARICETVKELRTEGKQHHNLSRSHYHKFRQLQLTLGILGHKVILVSSGAIGVGCHKMGLRERPSKLAQRQAVAAVGQIHLMRYYQDFFAALGLVS